MFAHRAHSSWVTFWFQCEWVQASTRCCGWPLPPDECPLPRSQPQVDPAALQASSCRARLRDSSRPTQHSASGPGRGKSLGLRMRQPFEISFQTQGRHPAGVCSVNFVDRPASVRKSFRRWLSRSRVIQVLTGARPTCGTSDPVGSWLFSPLEVGVGRVGPCGGGACWAERRQQS